MKGQVKDPGGTTRAGGRLGLRPWRWGLRARLLWAVVWRKDIELAKAALHIVQSNQVQTSDLAGAAAGRDRFHVLSMAADKTRSLPGLCLEFGVFQGVTLRHLAREIGPNRRAVGFDTFEGLPGDWGELLPQGTFATNVPSFQEFPNVRLEVGRIEDRLPKFLESDSSPLALVHIDCPFYEINVFILERVLPRMAKGSIVVFDEYYGFPSYEEHEFRAWAEMRARFKIVAAPFAYSNQSAAFELKDNPLCPA